MNVSHQMISARINIKGCTQDTVGVVLVETHDSFMMQWHPREEYPGALQEICTNPPRNNAVLRWVSVSTSQVSKICKRRSQSHYVVIEHKYE